MQTHQWHSSHQSQKIKKKEEKIEKRRERSWYDDERHILMEYTLTIGTTHNSQILKYFVSCDTEGSLQE